jgi:hypothetical protein
VKRYNLAAMSADELWALTLAPGSLMRSIEAPAGALIGVYPAPASAPDGQLWAIQRPFGRTARGTRPAS